MRFTTFIVAVLATTSLFAQQVTKKEIAGISTFAQVETTIACGGAFQPKPGTVLRVTSQQSEFSTTGVVRRFRTGKDNIPRIHIEFVGEDWPLDIEEDKG